MPTSKILIYWTYIVMIFFIPRLMSVSALFCTKPWYYITPIFWMSKDYGRMKRSQLITHDYATKVATFSMVKL